MTMEVLFSPVVCNYLLPWGREACTSRGRAGSIGQSGFSANPASVALAEGRGRRDSLRYLRGTASLSLSECSYGGLGKGKCIVDSSR